MEMAAGVGSVIVGSSVGDLTFSEFGQSAQIDLLQRQLDLLKADVKEAKADVAEARADAAKAKIEADEAKADASRARDAAQAATKSAARSSARLGQVEDALKRAIGQKPRKRVWAAGCLTALGTISGVVGALLALFPAS
jgi:chromosome segregation ATPase